MSKVYCALGFIILLLVQPAYAASPGNADAGRDLVMRSCVTCHAAAETKVTADTAPPLSFVAKDNKQNPAWVRGWLMDPHPPMPGIMLSRQQIDDIIAFLDTLPEAAPSGNK